MSSSDLLSSRTYNEPALVRLAQGHGKHATQAQGRLIVAHREFIRGLAAEFCPFREILEDAIQEASIAFLAAIKHYNPRRGATLKTFAYRYIVGAVLRFVKSERGGGQLPQPVLFSEIVANGRASSEDDFSDDDILTLQIKNLRDVEPGFSHVETSVAASRPLRDFTSRLSSAQRATVREVVLKGKTQSEAARTLKVSREAVRKNLLRALRLGKEVVRIDYRTV